MALAVTGSHSLGLMAFHKCEIPNFDVLILLLHGVLVKSETPCYLQLVVSSVRK